MKPFHSEFILVRGLRYHVRVWGGYHAPKLFMLHGWMDVSASFQFMVDCLRREWRIIAPDWRGFGLTQPSGADTYWFPDYLGDLDAILKYYAGEEAVDLIGHSMGGNVAMLYAGVRPERVRKLINLEGFGLPATSPEQAPQRYAAWLDQLRRPADMPSFGSLAEVAARLQKNNPRLSDERAGFLSRYWARQNEAGRWEILADPVHKRASPQLYDVQQVLSCWERIRASVLWVEAGQTDIWRWMGTKQQARAEIERRIACIPRVHRLIIDDAGHMVHHDQPQALADAIEAFLE